MSVLHKQIIIESNGKSVTYKNITNQIKQFVEESEVKNGICVVSTPHTTCSVIFEEFVHDTDWNGDEYLHVDMNRILNKIIPRQVTESDYLYPGPKHVEFLMDLAKQDPQYSPDPVTILNGDAHIKGSLFGPSETLVLKNGDLQIGSVGYIYYIDWDPNRVRQRKCNLVIIGE